MSAINISIPSTVLSSIQTALDQTMALQEQDVVLYFPPTLQAISGSINVPAGTDWTNSVWSAGMPQPLHSQQQNNPYASQDGFMSIETTGTIRMVIYPNPTKFNNIFPPGNRLQDGMIVTRGYVSDLPSVLNATRMETYLQAGTNHYKYKLEGDPVMPGTIIPNRYFYSLWGRL